MKPRGLLIVHCAIASLFFACGAGGDGTHDTPTHPIASTAEATPSVPQTVIASFGKLEPFESFESAEQLLGWKILRPSETRFQQRGGLLRTSAAVGLPRLEQAYQIGGGNALVEIVQAPEKYDLLESGDPRTIGEFDGLWWTDPPLKAFYFFSGQTIDGQRIRVAVYTNRSSTFTEAEFTAFVASLGFGSP